ncbi:MAG TPA: cupredoxin domain-containing protein [Terriglobia bacterium]|nr:cupredoxin domain-containing protein [Terriglobia bacterium]
MNKIRVTFMFIVLLATVAVASLAQQDAPPTASATGEGREITMTAKKYEFDPNVITVKQGDHVKLVITSLDRDHGIKLKAYGIKERLKKGVPTTVEFTASKAGTFPFECSVECGFGHHGMKGKLVVEAPAQQ